MLANNLVRVTFFNSDLDRDICKYYFEETYVFYSNLPPRNLRGNVYLLCTFDFEELASKSIFIQSRLIKFFPWRYILNHQYFVYSDYRIDIHPRFFSEIDTNDFPVFLKHREDGVYLHELFRNYDRKRISFLDFISFLNLAEGHLKAPISENGVICLKKTDYMCFSEFLEYISKVNRDQLILPLLIKIPYKYFSCRLDSLKYFHVNSKKFILKNFIKRLFGWLYSFFYF